jgi:cytidyltransferase-like protein
MKKVVVSGGFDPVHVGHVRMMKEAKALGDYLVVVLNNDNWIRAKRRADPVKYHGRVEPFMREFERFEILSSIRYVDEVYLTKHEEGCVDMSVCSALKDILPDVYANGGDRWSGNIPELSLCRQYGILVVDGVGGGKVQSSSDLIRRIEDGRGQKND